MSEAGMWTLLRPLMKGLDPVRIESHGTAQGIPDVNYSGGWVELKFKECWPPMGGPLRVEHFTTMQRAWHVKRREAGGRSFVLLKVGAKEWLLFDGAIAAGCLGYVTKELLYRYALVRWERKPTAEEIVTWLMK